MVKADLSRDYYADLGLEPTADIDTIKRQFKKLALKYHPDRNQGRESEVTAIFQKIQSAQEVLTDPQERAKYDRNRLTQSAGSFRQSYNGATSSNVRGNPWANAGSQWAPPPKPPPAPTSRRPHHPPPPSAGAQRYRNFETPKTSANQAAQEGAEARKNTYEAWEHMRNQRTGEGVRPGPGRTWKTPQPVPNDYPKSGREESNSYKHAPPPRTKPGYDEFRAGAAPPPSPHRRAQSSSSTNRKGFMPNTPGGDEGPAPKGAYSGYSKKSTAPPPPPRNFESMNAAPDPLREFRERADPTYEPRLSTPYQTHGGEKLNPFENANINRSKSTRERSDQFESTKHVPRTGSHPNLASPHRSSSFADRSSMPRKPFPKTPSVETSSSDDGPEIKAHRPSRPRPFAAPRSPASRNETSMPDGPRPSNSRKPSRLSEFRKWWKEEGGTGDHQLNDFPPDGPPGGSGQANPDNNGENIFSFNVDHNTFKRTNSHPNGFRASSAENISTKFTPEDWDGKFEAGADYFRPEQKAANVTHRGRAQSTSRSRGRSPIKVRPVDPKSIPRPEEQTPMESPGGTKFSAEEWAQSFKPQTFAPPPIPTRSNPGVGSTKRRPTLRPTMGTAAVVDDGDSTDEKPLFTGRKSTTSQIPTPPSPDAMDVDTPPVPAAKTPPPSTKSNGGLKVNTESPQKRPAAPSTSASPTDVEAERLKVNFDDLKIQDLISSLELPSPPTPPTPPSTTLVLTPTHPSYITYKEAFKMYMQDWDLFNSRIMLHLVARKNQNDALATRRWEDNRGLEIYRLGLKEDGVVLGHLQAAMMSHEMVVTEWAVVRERVKRVEAQNGGVGERLRPRKKTH